MARSPRLGQPSLNGTSVEVEGLRDLMRDLRKLGDKDAAREVRGALKKAAAPIAADAARRAPRSDRDRRNWKYKKHLADTIRPAVQGNKVFIRSPAPHGKTVHWGGRHPADTHNREKWVVVRGRPFISDAVEAHADRLVDMIGDGLEDAAVKNGWR
jgi:HK97 gp10 family phage protein